MCVILQLHTGGYEISVCLCGCLVLLYLWERFVVSFKRPFTEREDDVGLWFLLKLQLVFGVRSV